MTKINDLYKIKNKLLMELFNQYTYPFEILSNIHDFILQVGPKLGNDYLLLKEHVWIHKSVEVGSNVEIIGPAIIMQNTVLRHNAFLRENVIIGENSTIGNSCEIKNSIINDFCEIPHFNYVGDSILGNHVHLGAGVVLANLRLDKKNISIEKIDTSLRKIGAFIGDNAQVGCNSVINPGTIIYPNVVIYPLKNVGGVIRDNKTDIEVKKI